MTSRLEKMGIPLPITEWAPGTSDATKIECLTAQVGILTSNIRELTKAVVELQYKLEDRGAP